MKKVALFSILTFFWLSVSSHSAMNDYCVIPAQSLSITKPNVLILTDFSGSMQYPAHQDCVFTNYDTITNVAKCGTPPSSTSLNYDPTKEGGYYGLFDRTKYYKHASDKFQVNSSCSSYTDKIGSIGASAGTACISGNLLNWITATRIDVARQVMTGRGKTITSGATDYQSEGADVIYTDTNLNCKFTVTNTSTKTRRITIENESFTKTCRLGTLTAASNIYVPSTGTGVIQDFFDKAAFEFAIFLTDWNRTTGATPYKGKMLAGKNSSVTSLVAAMSNEQPYAGTPTGEAMLEAKDFFKQSNDNKYEDSTTYLSKGDGDKDPWYDGSGTTASKKIPCRKSFVLLISDGVWSGSIDPVNPAKDMRTTDLRSDLTGSQTITTYVVYAFGDKDTTKKQQGRQAMLTTAIFGGFDDNDKNGYPYPFTGSPPDSRDVTYPLNGCGKGGNWDARCKEWDKEGKGLPYNFFEADDGEKLKEEIVNALSDILRKASSGTAASVLASSEGSGANILQSVFYPKRMFDNTEISWTGEMQNLWYYIDPYLQNASLREDTNSNDILDFINDYAIEFFFDSDFKTKVKRYSINTDGSRKEPNIDTVALEEIKNLWEVGSLLFQRNLSTSPRKIYTTIDGKSFLTNDFTTANSTTLASYLNKDADTARAEQTIRYVHGEDLSGYRNRTVKISGTEGVWKLGDIVSSTPKIQSSIPANTYHLHAPDGYSDTTYLDYIKTTNYLNRGMAYVGGNDGMLHAFKFGTLQQTWSGQETNERAILANPDPEASPLGSEAWSFIPKNVLPYLEYLMEKEYGHLNYVDLPSLVVDASISGESTDTKTVSSWKTVLIGGMGLGGASKDSGDSCTTGSDGTCVKAPMADVGYSSYFAIDVTDPDSPQLLWEFSDPNLGFSTSGPAIVRVGDPAKNGKWFAVFASGPTGAIDTTYHQFLGRSDQNLRLFVLDLATGSVVRTIVTTLSDAFGGSLSGAVIDVDKGNPTSSSRYSDDVLYLGYTQKDSSTSAWTNGGVLRLVTMGDPDPANWKYSSVISGVGPVTSSIAKLQDRKKKELWLYFGTGRYFYRYEDTVDDPSGQRALYGFKEPCYTTSNTIDTESASCSPITNPGSVLHDQSGTSPASGLSTGKIGWYINLDAAAGTFGAERVITDPLAVFSGVVFFITYIPSADVCASGGKTYIWAVRYNLGNAVGGMKGKVVTQVSTGVIQEVDLATGFSGTGSMGSRRTAAIDGMPPQRQGMSILIPPRPLKKFMHIREK
jgi:type IV pilus assembly protein PilY1